MGDRRMLRPSIVLVGLTAVTTVSHSCTTYAGGSAVGPQDAAGQAEHSIQQPEVSTNGALQQPVCCMPPEPDYEKVMRNEFRAAQAEGTREALVRFMARHPDHPLADQASALLYGAGSTYGRPQARDGSGDPDHDIYSAFDRARQQNTIAAYDAFIERFAPHPLAEQARRLRGDLR